MKSNPTIRTKAAETPAEDWSQHEHVTPQANADAHKLIESTGNAELAKQAIDAAQQQPQVPPADKDGFAKQLGFVSFLDMFEASTTLATPDDRDWSITPLNDGRWLVWNAQDLTVAAETTSRDDAIQEVERRAGKNVTRSTKKKQSAK